MTFRPEDARARLRAHLGGSTTLVSTDVPVGETVFRICHPFSAEALISEEDFERDERLPYWADLWPSARALAGRLAAADLSDRRTIELGCGVGLPTAVALWRGASVLATDHYEAALDFTRYNATTNARDAADRLRTGLLDWHEPRPEVIGTFDLVLAADVLYERRSAPALADLVPRLLGPGGEILLADPRRAGASAFLEAMRGRGFYVASQGEVVRRESGDVLVFLHRLGRTSDG